jgi:hypothetical protein
MIMSTDPTLFELPLVPNEFGVVLPPSNLRQIDYSGLDFDTSRRAIFEYIRTYFPNEFNDFVASNGIVMLVEIVASVVAKLSLRADILANESTLPTATTEQAVQNHLALIDQRMKRQTPASVDIEISVDAPVSSDIAVEPGSSFSVSGPDNTIVNYEVYRAPNDWSSNIILPAGKRAVIAYGIEGIFGPDITVTSPGGPNQRFTLDEPDVLESPLIVTVVNNNISETWLATTSPLEKYGANDKVVEVLFTSERVTFRFGNDVNGKAPISGSDITFRYRVGGGRRGKIGVDVIDATRILTPVPPSNAAVLVRFRNVTPSIGGTDKETIAEAKRRAPRDYALQGNIVTAEDYAQASTMFNHPIYGKVSKAVATLRSGLNANIVELYILAEGTDLIPTAPSKGLKVGLETYINDINVLTDDVVVLDGAVKPIDVDMNIVIDKNADASVIKSRVEAAITAYFDPNYWDLGEALYISNLVEAVESIDGISYVDLFSPSDNIIPTGKIADPMSAGIGFNEMIIEGTRKTAYYYEKTPAPGGIRTGL